MGGGLRRYRGLTCNQFQAQSQREEQHWELVCLCGKAVEGQSRDAAIEREAGLMEAGYSAAGVKGDRW